jgi:hypothetical protein
MAADVSRAISGKSRPILNFPSYDRRAARAMKPLLNLILNMWTANALEPSIKGSQQLVDPARL